THGLVEERSCHRATLPAATTPGRAVRRLASYTTPSASSTPLPSSQPVTGATGGPATQGRQFGALGLGHRARAAAADPRPDERSGSELAGVGQPEVRGKSTGGWAEP